MWAPLPFVEDFLEPAHQNHNHPLPHSDLATSAHIDHVHALRHASSRAAAVVGSSLLTGKLSLFSSMATSNNVTSAAASAVAAAAANVTAASMNESDSCSGATYDQMVFFTEFSFYVDVVAQIVVGALGFMANLVVVPILCG